MLRVLLAKRAGRTDLARAALTTLARQRCDLLDPALYPDPLAGLMDAVLEGMRRFPQQDAVRLTLGNLLLRARRYRQAEAAYREALRLQPDSPPVLLGLARIALADGDAPTALRLLDRALPRAPDTPEIRSVRAEALLVLGRPRQARAEIERALRSDATSALDLARLADLLWETGGYDRSEQLYRYALRREAGLASARFGLARCLERRREDAEAEISFRAAAALNPTSERYHLALALLLERRGQAALAAVSRARARRAQALDARLRTLERAASSTAGTLRVLCRVADAGAGQAARILLERLVAPAGVRAFAAAHLDHLQGRAGKADLGPALAALRPEALWSFASGPPTVITVSEQIDPQVPAVRKRFLPAVLPELFR
jgi:tetratricopeptide (TPR) repeat protein